MNYYLITGQGIIACACWFFVGCGAAWAVYSRRIMDTMMERIGLSLVALTTWGTAYRIFKAGFVSEGGLAMAIASTIYVVAILLKHARCEEPKLPQDKTGPAPLGGITEDCSK